MRSRKESSDNPAEGHESLEGQVVAIIFQSEDTGFAVVSLRSDEFQATTAAGKLGQVHEGEFLKLHGKWAEHPRFGRQFQAQWSEHTSPTTLDGLEKYLGSGAFPGVGADMAKRLVDHFGEHTMKALEGSSDTLQAVPGIGPKRAEALAAGFREGRSRHRVLAELRGFGLNANHASNLYERWQAKAVERVKQDPYALVGDLRGVGFQTADRIAEAVGIPKDSGVRARGVLVHLLREASREGHVCLPETHVIERLDQVGLSAESIIEGVQGAINSNRVVLVKLDPTVGMQAGEADGTSDPTAPPCTQAFYLTELQDAEAGLADEIRRLQDPQAASMASQDQVLQAIESTAFRPDESQRAALEMALSDSFAVVTGGPGTGKTTTLRLLLEILDRAGGGAEGRADSGLIVKLASPTGRAAKRLQEATGREASTIHRLLGFDPTNGGFKHDAEVPLELDVLIVDEVSMLDLPLAYALLQAVPDGARVLLVGDADQLPSVGPGAVLRDLVALSTIATTRLERIHRQGEDSGITEAAHAILHGEIPQSVTTGDGRGDFFVSYREDPADATDLIEHVIADRMPDKYGIDPATDLLVLSPMYRGAMGVDELNQRLSERLNPDGTGPEWARGMREGDRVMVVRNDYEREVFNGDSGVVTSIDKQEMLVEIDGYIHTYLPAELDDLIPAYCVTVHRSQGSESKAVLIALSNTHYPMLRRNLLYTAVTRGKELVVLVTSRHALRRAVQNDQESARYGGLRARLEA